MAKRTVEVSERLKASPVLFAHVDFVCGVGGKAVVSTPPHEDRVYKEATLKQYEFITTKLGLYQDEISISPNQSDSDT